MPAELDIHSVTCLVSGDFQVVRHPQIPNASPRRCQVFVSDREIFSCLFPGIIKANAIYYGSELAVEIVWEMLYSARLGIGSHTADGSEGNLIFMYTSPDYSMGNHNHPYGEIPCLAFPYDFTIKEVGESDYSSITNPPFPYYLPGKELENRGSVTVGANPRSIYEGENIQLRNFSLSLSNGWGETQRTIFPEIGEIMYLGWGEPFVLNQNYDRSASVVGRKYLPNPDAAQIIMRSLDSNIYSSLYRLVADPLPPPCDIPITVDPQYRDTGHFCMSYPEYTTLMTRFPQMNQNINTTNNLLRESL